MMFGASPVITGSTAAIGSMLPTDESGLNIAFLRAPSSTDSVDSG